MLHNLTEVLAQIFPDEVWDDSAGATADRVIRFWQEFNNNEASAPDMRTFPAQAQQMILVKDIEFASLCAHHLLPFYGVAHVAYLPHELQVGLSKIPRLVQHYARRPQTQERLAHQIIDQMQAQLKPKGSAILMEATHTCMSCRGVTARNAKMITSELRGIFLTAQGPRDEFFMALERR